MNVEDKDLNLQELLSQWPNSAEGQLCARLLRRFLVTKLVETASNADGTPMSAGAEVGADKAHAQLIKNFRTLATAPPDAKPSGPLIPPLHRQQTQPQTEKKP